MIILPTDEGEGSSKIIGVFETTAPSGRTKQQAMMMRLIDIITSIAVIFICFGILFWFDMHNHLFHRSVNAIVLSLTGVSSLIFVFIGIYLTYVVESKYGPDYNKSHASYIHAAAVALCVGFVSFIVTFWPVYRFWTFLLSFTLLTLMVRLITIVPANVTTLPKTEAVGEN
ncbi:TM2 protein [Perkinsela sp. CCAP 1560/4]|nr:TM2 protein [Perkinsela sp. CCAP 1560/4]KNH08304.1 TM2 protein [Perkinsela sp. CCAP 1560/4]|eukprot:KNH03684.1 TM2 protein [Perkinsela sp. CCAP 1560/4]